MPWKEKAVEKLREEFVLAANQESANISKLCREFEITRRTGYKWLERAKQNVGMQDKSRRPNTIANKTDIETERVIVELRNKYPGWGAKKLHHVLTKQGNQLPSIRTVNNILNRNNCISEEEAIKRKAYCRFEKEHCNEMWQADFKGDFALLDGSRCYPLTILDDHSRYSIMIDAKPNTKGVKESFRRAFVEYGMPKSVLTDNGPQFAGFRGGYNQLERWFMEHDILPIHGRIMHPQTQGKIERFHRSLKNELLNHKQFENLQDADNNLQQWRTLYNEIRPHEALGMKCPADVFVPSSREYSDTVASYDIDSAWHTIKVNNWGYIRFNKWQTYLSETFADTRLEFCPNPLGDSFLIRFRNFTIASVDPNTGELINRKIFRI